MKFTFKTPIFLLGFMASLIFVITIMTLIGLRQDLISKDLLSNAIPWDAAHKTFASKVNKDIVQMEHSAFSLASILKDLVGKDFEPDLRKQNIHTISKLGLEWEKEMLQGKDKIWRTKPENFNSPFEAGLWVPSYVPLEGTREERLLQATYVLGIYGRGVVNETITDAFYLSRDGVNSLYWPNSPSYIYDTSTETDFRESNWITVSDPAKNKDIEPHWTKPIWDSAIKSWWIGVSAPIISSSGKWEGVAGHDLISSALFANIQDLKDLEAAKILVISDDQIIYEHGFNSMQNPNGFLKADDFKNEEKALVLKILASVKNGDALKPRISDIVDEKQNYLESSAYFYSTIPIKGPDLISVAVFGGSEVIENLSQIGDRTLGLIIAYVLLFISITIIIIIIIVQKLRQLVNSRTQDLARTIDELNETRANLLMKEKLASLGGLVAGVSHELNTPLGICLTATTHMEVALNKIMIASQEGKLTKQQFEDFEKSQKDGLGITLRNLERAIGIVQHFKLIGREEGQGESTHFELNNFLEEMVFTLRPNLREKKVLVVIDCPRNFMVHLPAPALYHVIVNLIQNSVIHAFENREDNRIDIIVGKKQDELVLQFSDNGNGMNEEIMEKLFEPFFTTKRNSGGTGIGTQIIHSMVYGALGGKLEVSSSPNEGTVWNISLPLKDSNA